MISDFLEFDQHPMKLRYRLKDGWVIKAHTHLDDWQSAEGNRRPIPVRRLNRRTIIKHAKITDSKSMYGYEPGGAYWENTHDMIKNLTPADPGTRDNAWIFESLPVYIKQSRLLEDHKRELQAMHPCNIH